jgi:hypothetical protein
MLQIGKAGEHFVCYDLIINGVNAFLADQGLPYDVLADFGNNIKKIQVKTVTKKTILSKGGKEVYQFNLEGTKNNIGRTSAKNFDYLAFVFLDLKKIQYMRVGRIKKENGYLIQSIYFRIKDNSRRKKAKYIIGNFNDLYEDIKKT